MPFITEGKTNLRYILIVIVIAVIVGVGILAYNIFQKKNNLVYDPEVGEEIYVNSLLIFGNEKEVEEAIKQFDGKITLSTGLDTYIVEFGISELSDLITIKEQLENLGFEVQKVLKSVNPAEKVK